jgi:hypothetical protein
VFTNHLNHHYFTTKAKLNGHKARWIEELATFDFTIIYYKKSKNPTDTLLQRFDLKDDSELIVKRHQPLPSFLSKFQLLESFSADI